MDAAVAVGQRYSWAGKTWRVVSVDVAHNRATVANVARPTNTATMPLAQFRPMQPDHDPEDTCLCGQWPIGEYGAVCPSCVTDGLA